MLHTTTSGQYITYPLLGKKTLHLNNQASVAEGLMAARLIIRFSFRTPWVQIPPDAVSVG